QVLHDFAFVAFPPGEVFEYSNFSLGIAEYVLEESAGVSFAEYMKAEVFGPLGMHSTSMGAEPGDNNSFAKRYSSDLESLQRTFFIPSGGGGAFSSAEDLLAFAMFHLGNRRDGQPEVLSDEALDQMHHDKSASQGATGSGPGWALGIGSVTLDDGTSWYVSNGSVGGGNAIVLMYPEENTAIVCLTNRTGTIADQIANEIADALIEDHPGKFAKAIELWREGQPSSYETSEAMLGTWEGWLQSGEHKLPVSFQFGDSGEIAVSIDGSDPVPVRNPRLGKGQFRGRLGVAVPNSINAREIAGGLTDVKLVVGDGVMSGYMGTQFEMEHASFSIPVYVEVRKVR
ncbi:MAG: serine hydrolase domain-containing protein, partial [Woeseiaceae bacterium]